MVGATVAGAVSNCSSGPRLQLAVAAFGPSAALSEAGAPLPCLVITMTKTISPVGTMTITAATSRRSNVDTRRALSQATTGTIANRTQ